MDKLGTFINEIKNYKNYQNEISNDKKKIYKIIDSLKEKIKYKEYLEAGVTGVDPFKEHASSPNQIFLQELRLDKIEELNDLYELREALENYIYKNEKPTIIKDDWKNTFEKVEALKEDIRNKRYVVKKTKNRLEKMDEITKYIFKEKYINNKSFEKLSKEINLSIGGIQQRMRSEFNKED